MGVWCCKSPAEGDENIFKEEFLAAENRGGGAQLHLNDTDSERCVRLSSSAELTK